VAGQIAVLAAGGLIGLSAPASAASGASAASAVDMANEHGQDAGPDGAVRDGDGDGDHDCRGRRHWHWFWGGRHQRRGESEDLAGFPWAWWVPALRRCPEPGNQGTVVPLAVTVPRSGMFFVTFTPCALNLAASGLTATAVLEDITVTDTRNYYPGWSESSQVSGFTGPGTAPGSVTSGNQLGTSKVAGAPQDGAPQGGTVTITFITAGPSNERFASIQVKA
jgi:hypothetical protein